VLPNYIYWGILIIILSSQGDKLNFKIIAVASFWGILFSTFFYYIQNIIPDLPGLTRLTPNSYSFILICFSPLAIYHYSKQKNLISGLFLLLVLLVVLFYEGRRAGFIFVLCGGLMTLFLTKIKFKILIISFVAFISVLGILSIDKIEQLILNSNDRIHGLIYQSSEIKTSDQSFLVRKAMIEKGLIIFMEHPLLGIGLNNFSNYYVNIDYEFEGGYLIRHDNQIYNESTSAHNSYISLLAEGGLLLFLPFIFLLFRIIVPTFLNYNSLPEYHRPILISLIFMVFHLGEYIVFESCKLLQILKTY
jgi:O-antigen ligase